ncbi:major facilitator superfamily domain-containing protein [Cercophora newfieldiana]|uniref:Major facilitator superfamily domain-containing protein n=1 Tax=Cercophora newfieldiana TaxID=92897 RepID=A0AA39XVX0_9PEZI|nr:major facilitator superfamily domain-containing protein [Cercophora newfieldiana]
MHVRVRGPIQRCLLKAVRNWFFPPGRAWIIIAQLAGINFITSVSSGLITVGLPTIASDLHLDDSLLVWPVSVYSLTSASCFLLAGAIADVMGPRIVNLTGCFLLAIFIAACGLSQTGIQLVMFRAMQGIASALVVPSSVAIVSRAVASGRPRNIGFSCLGLAMPAGFALGLVLGGVFISGPGWRVGYYFGGAVAFLLWVVGITALPAAPLRKRLASEVDWIGAVMASTCLATLSYVLAMLSSDVGEIRNPTNIGLLCLSIIAIPVFVFWMNRQEKAGNPALIPNSIWKNTAFTSVSIMILLSVSVMNSMELFSSLFFQEVQRTTALGASLRLLPNLIFGTFINLTTGFVIHKVPAIYAVLISSGLCTGAPLIMALINPDWPYWNAAFAAQLLAPMSADVLFTVGLIVVSDVFPPETQALAGAVFNTLSQVGVSLGLTTMSVISATITEKSTAGDSDKHSPVALMEGYRAVFWALFSWMVATCVVGVFGLKKVGNIGVKKEQ